MVPGLSHPFPLAEAVAQLRPSALRAVLARAAHPEVRSFAIGMPDTRLLPHGALQRAAREVLAEGPTALQYVLPSHSLKEEIVHLMAVRGVRCRAEQILLCAGGQQAMTLLARLLLDPGGEVMVEGVIYDGMLKVLEPYSPRLVTLPTNAGAGIDVEAVEAHLARGVRPAFLYLIPDGHNPLGSSLSRATRQRLVEIARTWSLPIVEDDAYGHLYLDGEARPPLRALDDRWVLHIGSFSKVLAPSLRVGWIVAPETVMPKLEALKHAADLDVAPLGQQIAARYLESGEFPAHVERLRGAFRERRDALMGALEARFTGPLAGIRWHRPDSGMFLWLELPGAVDTVALLDRAIDAERVAFSPGSAFAADPTVRADSCLRLCFATLTPQQIEEGVARLARAITSFLA